MGNIASDIREGQFNRLYLIYGDDEYSRIFFRNRLKNALIPEDDMNLSEFSGKEVDVNTIMDTARTIPFLSERRVVVVTNSELFYSASKKKSDEESDDDTAEEKSPEAPAKRGGKKEYGLKDFLAEIPDTTVLIFCEEKVTKTLAVYKAAEKYGSVNCFETLKENNPHDMEKLRQTVLQKIGREKKNISYGTMELFLQRTGTDFQKVFTELEKLLSYTLNKEVITDDDVKAVVPERVEDKIFEMIECISARNQVRALDLYYDLRRKPEFGKKESEITILAGICRHYNQVYLVKELSKTGMSSMDILKAAKFKNVQPKSADYLRNKYLTIARKYSSEDLKKAIEMCLEYDRNIKSGIMKKEIAVEMVIVAMSSKARVEEF